MDFGQALFLCGRQTALIQKIQAGGWDAEDFFRILHHFRKQVILVGIRNICRCCGDRGKVYRICEKKQSGRYTRNDVRTAWTEEIMRNNVFLIGFMGAGKSTIARTLEQEYQMNLVEMDEQIEAEQGMKISEIFAQKGEEYFRRLETQLLENLQQQNNTVVSCGGGVPMRECNVTAMRKSGKVVYLSARPETIYERVKDFHTRPLLEGNMNVPYITELMQKRLSKYLEAADITVAVDEKDAMQICREILAQI